MLATAVGYAGGRTPHPTYHNLADHAEAVRLEFDPEVISFETLLEMFWAGHDPTRSLAGSQYRAELFCEDERQRAIAEASCVQIEARVGASVATELRVGVPFHSAEAYHQKWRLRRQPELWAELQQYYPSEVELLASTAAAKLNGYVAGCASRTQLERDIPRLGLSPEAEDRLHALGTRRS